jgi:hypothetical protein
MWSPDRMPVQTSGGVAAVNVNPYVVEANPGLHRLIAGRSVVTRQAAAHRSEKEGSK